MSNFWARQIAKDKPKAPPPAPGPWWHAETKPGSITAAHPGFGIPENKEPPEAVPGEVLIDRRKFQSQVQDIGECPSCGSSNYFKVTGSKPRCYECGYPVMQSTSGMSATSDGSPPRQARQVSKGSNYHPQEIIGRLR
jgi:hypothetical protein